MRKGLINTVLSCVLLLVFGVGLTACNTIEGAGRDIEKAGEAIKDAARKN